MKKISSLFLIINVKTLIITISAVMSTFVCQHFHIMAEFPLALIATAIVFPIVFSIGGAYKRRERVLAEYAVIKAHGHAIYFAARDWLPETSEKVLEKTKKTLGVIMQSIRELFINSIEYMRANEKKVHKGFSELSMLVKNEFRKNGLPGGECSRSNQYVSKMMIAFESIKHIYQYRTPRTLRAFSDFFIKILPVLYGPYFAYIAQEYLSGSIIKDIILTYLMPVLFSMILVSLENIQTHLENPFDQIGEDDVIINVEKFISRLEL